jgi:hypothetical protein
MLEGVGRKELFLIKDDKKCFYCSNFVRERNDSLKGGEIVHFRQFLISALMLSAVMVLPDNAFAEKNELRPQKGQTSTSIPEHASITKPVPKAELETKSVPAKFEETQSLNQSMPEHARENQVQAKLLPAKNTPNQASLEKSLPEQANENAKSVVKKAEKAVQVNVSEQAEAVQVNDKVEKLNSKKSIQDTDREGKVGKVKPEKVDNIVYLQGEGLDNTTSVQEPQNAPADKEELPKVNQALNQTQRSNSSGGQSNDRVNHGLNNISLLDKWFDWNQHYFEIKLVQPYLSRQALMNNQWVNAPPSPPPQKAPLLTNVTRS